MGFTNYAKTHPAPAKPAATKPMVLRVTKHVLREDLTELNNRLVAAIEKANGAKVPDRVAKCYFWSKLDENIVKKLEYLSTRIEREGFNKVKARQSRYTFFSILWKVRGFVEYEKEKISIQELCELKAARTHKKLDKIQVLSLFCMKHPDKMRDF